MNINELLEEIRDSTKKSQYKIYSVNGAAAISKKTSISSDFPGRNWKLKSLEITFSSAPTTSESVTLTLNNISPNRPDTVLFSQNPSLTSATSIINIWEDSGLVRESGQEVTLAFTNTDVRTVEAEIVVEVL